MPALGLGRRVNAVIRRLRGRLCRGGGDADGGDGERTASDVAAGPEGTTEGAAAQGRYVTAIFARLDPAGPRIEVVNCGHNPGAVLLPEGEARILKASGTPLGMLPGMQYSSEKFEFPSGSRILLYTDGLTETLQAGVDEEFGLERLMETFRACSNPQAERVLDDVWEAIGSFSSHAPQTDDMTALAICHLDSSSQEIVHP